MRGGAGPPPVTRFRRHSFAPQMTELSRNQVFIRHGMFSQTIARRKIHQTIDGIMGYFGVVKRGITFDEVSYQLSLIGWEQSFANFGRNRWICFQSLLRPYRARCHLPMLSNDALVRCERRKVVVARARRSISASKIEMQFCNTEAFAECNSHPVAPVGVRRVLYDGIDAVPRHEALVPIGGWWRNNPNVVSFKIDAGVG